MGCGGSKTDVVATEPVGNGANGYHNHHNNNAAKSSKTPSKSASTMDAENRDMHRREEEIVKERARAQNDQEQGDKDTDGQQATETAAVKNSPTSQTTRTFTVLEIDKHNQDAGWPEWLSHKGKVYDGEAFRQHFRPYVEWRNDNSGDDDDENVSFDDPAYDYSWNIYVHVCLNKETNSWQNHNGVFVARNYRVSEKELDLHMPTFLLGKIVAPPADVYWGNVREDVSSLRNDLLEMEKGGGGGEDGEEEEGVMSGVKIDLLAKLTRWQNKYSVQEPPDDKPTPGQDPNERGYPLPVDPDTLRPALYDGSAEEFQYHIDGEAAWETLPEGLVKDDVMTPQQQEVQAKRDRRSDLQDTARMGRRRQQLCDDFVQRHELDPAIVQPFMQWAQVMEEGWKQFQTLCL